MCLVNKPVYALKIEIFKGDLFHLAVLAIGIERHIILPNAYELSGEHNQGSFSSSAAVFRCSGLQHSIERTKPRNEFFVSPSGFSSEASKESAGIETPPAPFQFPVRDVSPLLHLFLTAMKTQLTLLTPVKEELLVLRHIHGWRT